MPVAGPRGGMGRCRPRVLLCGLLLAAAVASGGRALPHLSDDVPFRVNWPGTELSLVRAGCGAGWEGPLGTRFRAE